MLIKPKKIRVKNVLPDVCKLYIFQPRTCENVPLNLGHFTLHMLCYISGYMFYKLF